MDSYSEFFLNSLKKLFVYTFFFASSPIRIQESWIFFFSRTLPVGAVRLRTLYALPFQAWWWEQVSCCPSGKTGLMKELAAHSVAVIAG